MLSQNKEVIFLDECVFSQKCYMKSAWSAPKTNITQSHKLNNQKCVAVIGAISAQRGLIHWDYRTKSIKSTDFVQFLHKLYNLRRNRKELHIVLDNCAVHKTKFV